MSTIKLKRGSGTPPNSSLEQYEVAMDVAAKQLYTSTDGTDVVTLSNEYTDADAVTAIESASSLTLSGTVDTDDMLTAMGGLTVDATGANPGDSYNTSLFAKRQVDGGAFSGDRTVATLWRDLDGEVINSGYDNRGTSLDYVLQSDSQGTTQYLGGVSMQSGGTATGAGHWVKAWAYDDGVTGFEIDTIFEANKDYFYTYGSLLAQTGAVITNTYGDDQGDNSVTPLVVKSGPNSDGAVISEFWNISEFADSKVKLRFGLEDTDTGDLTSHGEIRSVYDNDRKNIVLGLLDDDGSNFDYVLGVSKDTVNNNEKKINMSGELKVDTDGQDYNQCIFIEGDMTNRTDIYMNGLNTNLNWGAGTIPNNAEIFQNFTMTDDAQGDLAVGFFGAQYASADNGFLSTMKLTSQEHNFSNESTIGVNGKNAYTDVPFKYASYTTTERNALTVDAGTMIYNSTTAKLNFYTGSAWEAITSA